MSQRGRVSCNRFHYEKVAAPCSHTVRIGHRIYTLYKTLPSSFAVWEKNQMVGIVALHQQNGTALLKLKSATDIISILIRLQATLNYTVSNRFKMVNSISCKFPSNFDCPKWFWARNTFAGCSLLVPHIRTGESTERSETVHTTNKINQLNNSARAGCCATDCFLYYYYPKWIQCHFRTKGEATNLPRRSCVQLNPSIYLHSVDRITR